MYVLVEVGLGGGGGGKGGEGAKWGGGEVLDKIM